MPSVDRVVQAVWQLPYFTNIPEDVVTNVHHFIYTLAPDPTSVELAALANEIQAFYDDIYTAVNMGIWCQPSLATVTFYDLQQVPPRIPMASLPVPVTTTPFAGSTATEVAICLSVQGDIIPGIPPARQRGRVFLGGLANPMSVGSVSSFPTIGLTNRAGIAGAAAAFRTALAAQDWMWVVYSPTQNAVLGQETFEITNGWVDNTPDTQRRRGIEATSRTLWP